MSTYTYYKCLTGSNHSPIGKRLRWSVPRFENGEWVPGEWMPAIPYPSLCIRGYHAAVGVEGVVRWLQPNVYVIESQSPWKHDKSTKKAVTGGPVRLLAPTNWHGPAMALFALEQRFAYYNYLHIRDTMKLFAEYWEWLYKVRTRKPDYVPNGFENQQSILDSVQWQIRNYEHVKERFRYWFKHGLQL